MALVQAIPRGDSNGNTLTQHTTCCATTAITYDYPTPQDSLEIWNKGLVNLVLNVGTYTNQTILPGAKWKNDVIFSNFNIKSSAGSGEFQATAYDYANLPCMIMKGTTAQRPTSTSVVGQCYFDITLGKPVWKKTVTVWCDATGTTV